MPPITNTLLCVEKDEPFTHYNVSLVSAASELPHAEQVHHKFLVVGLTLGALALATIISTTIFYLVCRFAPARKRQQASYGKSIYRTESTTTPAGRRHTLFYSLQRWMRRYIKTPKKSTPSVYICKASYDYPMSNQPISSPDWLTRPLVLPRPVTPPPPTAIAGYRGQPTIHSNPADVQPVAAPVDISPSSYSRRSSGFSSMTIFEEDTLPKLISPISPI